MKSLKSAIALPAVILVMLVSCNLAPGPTNTTLQNDDYSGSGAVFAGGFANGEGVAVVLGPVAGDVKLEKVSLLFGGSSTSKTVTVAIYNDIGILVPGTVLYSGDFSLSPSDTMVQEIDLSSQNITIASGVSFRVAVFFQHNSTPTVGYDGDGFTPSKNLAYVSSAWAYNENLSIPGDWIIRAIVSRA